MKNRFVRSPMVSASKAVWGGAPRAVRRLFMLLALVCAVFGVQYSVVRAAAPSIGSVELTPGWITFGIDGTYVYPSTGDVIDLKTRKILTGLTDENGGEVHSEKMVEVHFRDREPSRTGDQFGIGRAHAAVR